MACTPCWDCPQFGSVQGMPEPAPEAVGSGSRWCRVWDTLGMCLGGVGCGGVGCWGCGISDAFGMCFGRVGCDGVGGWGCGDGCGGCVINTSVN